MSVTYTVVVDYDSEERVYNISVPALPGCFAWGKTKSQALTRAKEVMRAYLDTLVDLGQPIPEEVDVERVTIS
jgi:predicted RNase H-like HicB family nuclease